MGDLGVSCYENKLPIVALGPRPVDIRIDAAPRLTGFKLSFAASPRSIGDDGKELSMIMQSVKAVISDDAAVVRSFLIINDKLKRTSRIERAWWELELRRNA